MWQSKENTKLIKIKCKNIIEKQIYKKDGFLQHLKLDLDK